MAKQQTKSSPTSQGDVGAPITPKAVKINTPSIEEWIKNQIDHYILDNIPYRDYLDYMDYIAKDYAKAFPFKNEREINKFVEAYTLVTQEFDLFKNPPYEWQIRGRFDSLIES